MDARPLIRKSRKTVRLVIAVTILMVGFVALEYYSKPTLKPKLICQFALTSGSADRIEPNTKNSGCLVRTKTSIEEWRWSPPELQKVVHSPFGSQSNTLVLSQDGTLLARDSDDSIVTIVEVKSNMVIRRIERESAIYSVAISHDSTRLVIGTRFGGATVWDIKSGSLLFDCKRYVSLLRRIDDEKAHAVAISSDNDRVAVGTIDGSVEIWQLSDVHRLSKIQAQPSVLALAFSADGRLLITGSYGGGMSVWELGPTRR